MLMQNYFYSRKKTMFQIYFNHASNSFCCIADLIDNLLRFCIASCVEPTQLIEI